MDKSLFRDQATLLLSNLEEGREVRTYLSQFSKAEGGCFAVIKVGGGLLGERLAPLAERLALLQALGLKPIVVYGAGPQLDARFKDASIPIERKDGLRVTPAPALSIIAQEVSATGVALIKAVSQYGGRAMLAPPALVRAEAIDADQYGAVGEATGIDASALHDLLSTDAIPLVSCLTQDGKGQLLNVNADAVAREIARAVRPPKIVFLTPTGGLLDELGKIIDAINLADDYDRLLAESWLHSGMALKLEQIKKLLADLPLTSSVSIANTDNMMKELFTHGGAGTLVRSGEHISVVTQLDPFKLTDLIEGAFGRKLRPDYWQTVEPKYLVQTERYRAAALVTELDGIDCLDKFAVSQEARGEGLAKAVWRQLQSRSPSLIWRSRQNNPFNAFYMAMADGFLRRGQWLILWYGPSVEARLMPLADNLASRPEDFGDPL